MVRGAPQRSRRTAAEPAIELTDPQTTQPQGMRLSSNVPRAITVAIRTVPTSAVATRVVLFSPCPMETRYLL